MKHLFYLASLIDAEGIATSGVDLYVNTLPADITAGVMLRDPLMGHEIDEGLRGFFSSEFQMIVRDADIDAGHARAEKIAQALTVANVGNAEVWISWCRPMTLPISYPRSDGDDIEISIRFRLGFGLRAP